MGPLDHACGPQSPSAHFYQSRNAMPAASTLGGIRSSFTLPDRSRDDTSGPSAKAERSLGDRYAYNEDRSWARESIDVPEGCTFMMPGGYHPNGANFGRVPIGFPSGRVFELPDRSSRGTFGLSPHGQHPSTPLPDSRSWEYDEDNISPKTIPSWKTPAIGLVKDSLYAAQLPLRKWGNGAIYSNVQHGLPIASSVCFVGSEIPAGSGGIPSPPNLPPLWISTQSSPLGPRHTYAVEYHDPTMHRAHDGAQHEILSPLPRIFAARRCASLYSPSREAYNGEQKTRQFTTGEIVPHAPEVIGDIYDICLAATQRYLHQHVLNAWSRLDRGDTDRVELPRKTQPSRSAPRGASTPWAAGRHISNLRERRARRVRPQHHEPYSKSSPRRAKREESGDRLPAGTHIAPEPSKLLVNQLPYVCRSATGIPAFRNPWPSTPAAPATTPTPMPATPPPPINPSSNYKCEYSSSSPSSPSSNDDDSSASAAAAAHKITISPTSLAANTSAVCDLLWAQARRNRRAVVAVEREAARTMRSLLEWGGAVADARAAAAAGAAAAPSLKPDSIFARPEVVNPPPPPPRGPRVLDGALRFCEAFAAGRYVEAEREVGRLRREGKGKGKVTWNAGDELGGGDGGGDHDDEDEGAVEEGELLWPVEDVLRVANNAAQLCEWLDDANALQMLDHVVHTAGLCEH